MNEESKPKTTQAESNTTGPENKTAATVNQVNRQRGAKLLALREALAKGETSEREDKIEYLLEESKFQEPSLSEFSSEPSYKAATIARDEAFVRNMEAKFASSTSRANDRIAKVAEAITGTAIQNGELFAWVGDIRAVVINPVTRYDDIANGIDQAVTLITEEGEPKPFGFDITIGNSRKTFIKKLFRPYRDSSGQESDIIGMSRLKYGQEPTLDEDGAYKDIKRKTIDPIPRLTLAYKSEEVEGMVDDLTLEDDGEEIETFTNPESTKILHDTLQIFEQVVFYTRATEINLRKTNAEYKSETDPGKKAELAKRCQLLKEQLAKLKGLEETLKPVLLDAYKRARKETVGRNLNNVNPDSNIRRKLMCSGYLGTPTGNLLDIIHQFEGYADVYGDKRDEKEDEITQAYIQQELNERSKKYHRENPGKSFEPTYTVSQIAEIEFEAFLKAKEEMLSRCSHYMSENLEKGAEEYQQIIDEERKNP